jgi:hypothetical protein
MLLIECSLKDITITYVSAQQRMAGCDATDDE